MKHKSYDVDLANIDDIREVSLKSIFAVNAKEAIDIAIKNMAKPEEWVCVGLDAERF